jgi:hypothetical protein
MDDTVAAVDKVKTMSRAGVRRHFEGQFTAECMVKKYVAAYEQLIAGQHEVIKLPTASAFAPHYGELNGSARPSLSAAAMPA